MKALGATYWRIEYSLEFKTLIFARKWDFGILRDYSSRATTTMVMNCATTLLGTLPNRVEIERNRNRLKL